MTTTHHSPLGEIRDQLREPFISATVAALGEMASVELVVQAVGQTKLDQPLSDIAVVLALTSATKGSLILSFPERTAAALAGRILAGATEELDASMIHDCMGEIGNVIAGQAKALLADTPYRFAFSLPKVVVGGGPEFRSLPGRDCLMVAFRTDLGEFALQLVLEL